MSEELENLLNMALADGEVTEKERSIIVNKAIALGLDQDEVEMILDGKIALMKKEANVSPPVIEKPESNKFGKVKKCPSCGSLVKSFQIKCEYCEHEFSGTKGTEAVDSFVKGFNMITKTYKGATYDCFNCKKTNQVNVPELVDNISKCYNCGCKNTLHDGFKIENINLKLNYISSYNVPNEKEGTLNLLFHFYSEASRDITENETLFLDTDVESQKKIKAAFISKFSQTLEISKLMLIEDKSVMEQLNKMADNLTLKIKDEKKNKRLGELALYIFISIIMIVIFGAIIMDGKN